jgi:hypothetical protein
MMKKTEVENLTLLSLERNNVTNMCAKRPIRANENK